MNTRQEAELRPASGKAKSRSGGFWLGLFSWGIRPGMSFLERKTVLILGSVAFLMVSFGGLFAVTNFIQGRFPLFYYNAWGFLSGLTALFLLWRGRLFPALLTLAVVGGIGSFMTGLRYRNGTEINLLVFIILMVFLMESVFWRRLLVLLSGIGYIVVQASHYEFFQHAEVHRTRYLITIGIGIASLYIYSAVFRTVSDEHRRQVEEKNRELEKQRSLLEAERAALGRANAAKEKLFSLLSHDLLAPVGHVKDALDHFHAGRVGPERFAPVQDLVKKEVDGIYSLLSNLLEWSAGQSEAIVAQPERVSLSLLCGEAVGLLEHAVREKKLSLRNGIPPEAFVHADPHQTRAVFRNLLSNAVKFTPKGGEIGVEAGREDGFWRVAVRDSGIGMAPERIAELFSSDPAGYVSTPGTANERGLGLGLRLCRDFVAAQDGILGAESVPGRGSVFFFTLPAVA